MATAQKFLSVLGEFCPLIAPVPVHCFSITLTFSCVMFAYMFNGIIEKYKNNDHTCLYLSALTLAYLSEAV